MDRQGRELGELELRQEQPQQLGQEQDRLLESCRPVRWQH